MAISAADFNRGTAAGARGGRSGSTAAWWTQRREATLNWLALGLLLAAWNATDDAAVPKPRPRPETLRGYGYVSVRAATLHAEPRAKSPSG
jgi:hypothetical protein